MCPDRCQFIRNINNPAAVFKRGAVQLSVHFEGSSPVWCAKTYRYLKYY